MDAHKLLELAAKAMGYKYMNSALWDGRDVVEYSWNPLEDDGQALRVAVNLNLDITHSWSIVSGDDNYPMASVHVSFNYECSFYELKESNPCAATRRAIVQTAAEIGKNA